MLPPGKLATGARSELEPFLKEQPENDGLMGDLALTNMGLGDRAAALALAERATATSPLEKDAIDGSGALEFLARVSSTGRRARPRYHGNSKTALDTKHWSIWLEHPAYARAASARSDVRSAPERFALSETRQVGRTESGGQMTRRGTVATSASY